MTVKDQRNPIFHKFTDRNFDIAHTLIGVSKELGRSPAEVALNWATKRPGITSTIIGATSMSQLDENLRCLDFEIPDALHARLEQAGRPEQIFPYFLFGGDMQAFMNGEVKINKEPPWFRQRGFQAR